MTKHTDDNLNNDQKRRLTEKLNDILATLDKRNFRKAFVIISSIAQKCELDQKSREHAKQKKEDENKHHPIRPIRGEIYNVKISDDNVGTELNGNHLCVIISNDRKNIFSEKVNVVPIEGDGKKIDKKNNIQLTNKDLEDGKIDKDPSKIIGADVMTIDKARLDRRIGKVDNNKLKEITKMVKAQLAIY